MRANGHPPISASVIIPVRNGGRWLAVCLAALQQQTCPPNEIIVVDDGSTDESAAIAIRFGVTLLRQPQLGPAAARNAGARRAQGEILLFTDADCAPASDWVARMVAAFATRDVSGAKGEYRSHQPELVARFVQQEYQDRYDRMRGQARIDFVDTYSAAYRRDVFLAMGGFDTTFPTASVEDQEFSFRLAARGYRLVHVPGALVYHQHNRTVAHYLRRKYWIGYWKARVMQRHPAKLARDSHTPQRLKLQLGLAALGPLLMAGGQLGRRGWLKQAGGFAWILLLLSELPLYLKLLRRDAGVLVVAPLLVFGRAWALGGGLLWGSLQLLYTRITTNEAQQR